MKKIIYYLPRILAIAIVIFFGIFILEGFGPGFGWRDSLVHALIMLMLLGATIIAWQWPKVGGWAFIFIGAFFSLFFHPFWYNGLLIGAAPLLSGILFLLEGFEKKG